MIFHHSHPEAQPEYSDIAKANQVRKRHFSQRDPRRIAISVALAVHSPVPLLAGRLVVARHVFEARFAR